MDSICPRNAPNNVPFQRSLFLNTQTEYRVICLRIDFHYLLVGEHGKREEVSYSLTSIYSPKVMVNRCCIFDPKHFSKVLSKSTLNCRLELIPNNSYSLKIQSITKIGKNRKFNKLAEK